MCLAIVVHQEIPDWPVFVAANRDEFFGRPSSPPRLTQHAGVTLLSPRDEEAGGTWIGINDRRIFAVITNRTDQETPPRDRPSRGKLVQAVLSAPDIGRALRRVEESADEPYAPHQLVFGDLDRLWWAERTPTGARVQLLSSGLHVVANAGPLGDPRVGEAVRAQELWRHPEADIEPWSRARRILAQDREDGAGRPALCKDEGDRGTVSSTIFGVDGAGAIRLEHAEGPPNLTPYEERPFVLELRP